MFLPDQADDSGSYQDAEENTAAVQEDILDGTASCRNQQLMNLVRDGVDSADEKTVKQEMLFPAEPAFQADPDKESQNGKNKHMGEFSDQALDEEDERFVSCFIVFPDWIEQVEFKEAGIKHGISNRKAEAFRLFLLLGGKEEDRNHDDQRNGGTGISNPWFLHWAGVFDSCI